MAIPTVFLIADSVFQTDADVQRNMLREKRAEIRITSWTTEIDQTLLQLWFLEEYGKKTILHNTWWKRTWWNENIMSRASTFYCEMKPSQVKGVDSWKHEDRPNPGCEGLLSPRRTESTSTWPKRQKKFLLALRTDAGKPVAKTKPRPKPIFTLILVSIPWYERKWKDIEPRKFSQSCYEVTKLLRHDDSVHREEDGAIRFDDLTSKCKSEFDSTSHWSIRAWISFLAKGGRQKKWYQYCLNPNSSEHFLYFLAIQGHSGGTLVDPTLKDNVLSPDDFAEYIYHVGDAHDMHSIIECGLIPGSKSLKRDRHSVFFTAVNPM